MDRATLREPIRHRETLTLERTITLDALSAERLRFREIRPKEAFTLLDREGRTFRASLVSLERKSATAIVYEALPSSTESPAELSLFCAVLGRQRMLTVIQKATELGVVRVVPIVTERSVDFDGLAHEKAHAWPAQALRAARQCRRARIPDIREAVSIADALKDPAFVEADLRVHLDDREAIDGGVERARAERARVEPARIEAVAGGEPLRIAFAVGPEGGFTEEERFLFEASGITQLRLGGRVLRAETAAIIGVGILQHAYGDLR